MPKKAIRLQPDLEELLRHLYRTAGIPIDQYAQRPRAFSRLVNEWNGLSGRSDSADDIKHFMLTRRKAGKWVTFDGAHKRMSCPGEDVFTPDEWAILQELYVQLNKGRDRYAVDAELRNTLARMFGERTGRHVSGDLLYAAVMARQKGAEWVRITPPPEPETGFDDIDQVV